MDNEELKKKYLDCLDILDNMQRAIGILIEGGYTTGMTSMDLIQCAVNEYKEVDKIMQNPNLNIDKMIEEILDVQKESAQVIELDKKVRNNKH